MNQCAGGVVVPKDELMSQSDEDSGVKIRQLQQYLHRPGQIAAAPHPFVKRALKQAAKQSAYHLKQQYSFSPLQWIARWRDTPKEWLRHRLSSQSQDPKSQNKSQNQTENNL